MDELAIHQELYLFVILLYQYQRNLHLFSELEIFKHLRKAGNISWYVYDTNKEQYIELDNPLGREMVEIKEFDEMLEKILSDSLL